MRNFTYICLILISLILQINISNKLFLDYPKINLILIVLICLSIIEKPKIFLTLAFIAGMFIEFFENEFFGITTISFLIVCLLVNYLFQRFLGSYNFLVIMLTGLLSTFIYFFCFSIFAKIYLLFNIVSENFSFSKNFLFLVLGEAGLNSIIILFLFYPLIKLNGFFRKLEKFKKVSG